MLLSHLVYGLLPCISIQAYQGLEEENIEQKSPGAPSWGVDASGQPTAHRRKKIAKKTIGNGAHQEEENEVDLNLPGRKGLEDWWEKRD